MLVSLFAFMSALTANSDKPPIIDPASFEARKEESISGFSDVRTFSVEKEGNEDVLYLDLGWGKWYRAPMSCYGVGDPEHSLRIATITRSGFIDRFTRVNFYGISDNRPENECWLQSLKALTPEETVLLKLETQKSVDSRAKILADRDAKRAHKAQSN